MNNIDRSAGPAQDAHDHEAEFDAMIEEMPDASGGPLTKAEQAESARILGTQKT